jgi:hypothetical protein
MDRERIRQVSLCSLSIFARRVAKVFDQVRCIGRRCSGALVDRLDSDLTLNPGRSNTHGDLSLGIAARFRNS